METEKAKVKTKKKKLSAEETIITLLKTLRKRLREVDDVLYTTDMFVQGELIGYKDCLKMAMAWERAKEILGDDYYNELDITQQVNGLKIIPNLTIKPKKDKRKNK